MGIKELNDYVADDDESEHSAQEPSADQSASSTPRTPRCVTSRWPPGVMRIRLRRLSQPGAPKVVFLAVMAIRSKKRRQNSWVRGEDVNQRDMASEQLNSKGLMPVAGSAFTWTRTLAWCSPRHPPCRPAKSFPAIKPFNQFIGIFNPIDCIVLCFLWLHGYVLLV